MRIWHEKLISKLCQKHLCAMWRESLGCYKIITENKKGYRNHPAVKEFADCPQALWIRLRSVRKEMIKRGYHPKSIPMYVDGLWIVRPWQTLKQQVEVLKGKGCKCEV